MSSQLNRPGRRVWIALVALGLFSFPFTVAALQHEPAPPVTPSTINQPAVSVQEPVQEPVKEEEVIQGREKPEPEAPPCGGLTQADLARGTSETQVIYKLGHLWKIADQFYGKTITVDGEMHRQFTDRVFTIEDDGMFRDHDMLVISLVPMSDSVIPLQDSFERGKNVRVTGTLRPYDEAQLECLFGPLNVESREGHSFTKNPVLIIGYREPPKAAIVIMPAPVPAEIERPAAVQPPEQIAEVKPPEPAAVPAPAPPAPAETKPEAKPEPSRLPKTASNLPFVGLAGAFCIFAAFSIGLRRSASGRMN
jgi:hypothetical protein